MNRANALKFVILTIVLLAIAEGIWFLLFKFAPDMATLGASLVAGIAVGAVIPWIAGKLLRLPSATR